MKICMITGEYPPNSGGQGYYAHNLALQLVRLGHQVTVLTRGLWRTKKDTPEGIPVYRVACYPFYPFHLFFHARFLQKQLRRIKWQGYDIFHLHSPLIPRITVHKPAVVTEHGTAAGFINNLSGADLFTLVSKICKRMFVGYDQSVLRQGQLITAVSGSCHDELNAYYGLEDSLVIPNAVDAGVFRPAAGYDGAGNGSDTVLYAGSFIAKKGIFDLVEAAGILTFRDNIKLNYVLAGSGPLARAIRKRVKKYGLEELFSFPGFLDRPALLTAYQGAKMFVFPSYHEGLPTVILEALACGLPVVATNVPGNKDLIRDGQTGLLVEPRQPEKLAEAMKTLCCDEKMCRRLGETGRKMVTEQYSWSKVAREFEKQYQELLSK